MRRKMTTFSFSTFIAFVPQKFQVVLEEVSTEDGLSHLVHTLLSASVDIRELLSI